MNRVKVLRYAGRGFICVLFVTLSLALGEKGLTSAKVVKFLICANGVLLF